MPAFYRVPSKKWQRVVASNLKASYTVFTASHLEALGEMMRDDVKLQFRLPIDIRNWFKAYAGARNRSMNGQIIEILKDLKAEKEKAPNA